MKTCRLRVALASLILAACIAPLARGEDYVFFGRIESTGVGLVIVKDGVGASYQIQVDPAAQITQNGHLVRLDQLKVGAAARLVLEMGPFGRPIAVIIDAATRFGGTPATERSADRLKTSRVTT